MKSYIINIIFTLVFLFSISNIFLYLIPRPKGDKGDKGKTGIIGKGGLRGEIGDNGIKGYKGQKGEIGKSIGLQGELGDKGMTGFKGDPGDKGERGIKGEPGDKGPGGLRGIQGRKGKKGIKGPEGKLRYIPKTGDLDLIANKDKCIKINNDGTNDLMCPENMAVFNITAKKKDYFSTDSDIDSIMCCEVKIKDDILESYYNMDNNVLINLNLKLFGISQSIKAGVMTNRYTNEQIRRMDRNYTKIKTIIERLKDFRSVRDISRKNLLKLIGNEFETDYIKEYSENEVYKIKQTFESITAYEIYIIHLMSKFIRRKERDFETPSDITDNENIIKALIEFPRNNIAELERLTNIKYFQKPNVEDSTSTIPKSNETSPSNDYDFPSTPTPINDYDFDINTPIPSTPIPINYDTDSYVSANVNNPFGLRYAEDMDCSNVTFKNISGDNCENYIGIKDNQYNKCTFDRDEFTIDTIEGVRVKNIYCRNGNEKIADYNLDINKMWDRDIVL